MNALLLVFILISGGIVLAQVQPRTIVTGIVRDAKTGEALVGANVVMEKSTIGTITDSQGKYRIETPKPSANIICSFIGYDSQVHPVNKGRTQTININLNQSSIAIDEVVVRPARKAYRNKNNPAVELIDKVVEKKDENRKERFNFLEYRQYEKVQFAFSNVSDKFEQNGLFKNYHFIFDNIDTTKRIGNKILP
ncbi:MAG TPA: carboxypeptidase-like regulatory domain-containing protein, partial [Bacteroidales bacterium]|nr:carboxypeptidase-like regulatory domain-containing protein [Bacteroidales bacterium]